LKEVYIRRADPKYAHILKRNEAEQIQAFLQMKAQENGL
jgi:hypothetical protein